MSKLPVMSAKKVLKALERAGFQITGQKGSHIKLKKKSSEKVFIVMVPNHAEIAIGTLKSILRQAGLSPEEFLGIIERL